MENKPQKKNRILINFNAKNWAESAKKLKETYDELLASVRDKCKAECKEHDVKVKELKKNHEKIINLIKKESANISMKIKSEKDQHSNNTVETHEKLTKSELRHNSEKEMKNKTSKDYR